jgi:hypothetical protein
MLGQTLSNLTLTKPRMQGKKGRREYIKLGPLASVGLFVRTDLAAPYAVQVSLAC